MIVIDTLYLAALVAGLTGGLKRQGKRAIQYEPLNCERVALIGDAPEDIEMAHRAGMRAIGVLGGSPVPERLRDASPDALIETIRELPALLKMF